MDYVDDRSAYFLLLIFAMELRQMTVEDCIVFSDKFDIFAGEFSKFVFLTSQLAPGNASSWY